MKKFFLVVVALLLAITTILGATANAVQADLSGKMLRMHVIANSNSASDQALKLKVRDRVLKESAKFTAGVNNVKDAERIISAHLNDIESAAKDEIKKNGYTYPVRAEITNTYFPTRVYQFFSIPAGNYNAFRVIIGSGQGKNWWCVMFPPLCISASEGEVIQKADAAGLTPEEVKLISSGQTVYKYKFKIVEVFQELEEKVKQSF